MLPGDYIAMRLSGQIGMTIEGLSEEFSGTLKQLYFRRCDWPLRNT